MAPVFAKLLISQLVRTVTGFHKLAVQLVKARLRRGWAAFAKLLTSQLVRTATGFHKSAVQLVKARRRRGWPAVAKLVTLLHVSCKYPFLSHFVYPAGKPMIPHHLRYHRFEVYEYKFTRETFNAYFSDLITFTSPSSCKIYLEYSVDET